MAVKPDSASSRKHHIDITFDWPLSTFRRRRPVMVLRLTGAAGTMHVAMLQPTVCAQSRVAERQSRASALHSLSPQASEFTLHFASAGAV